MSDSKVEQIQPRNGVTEAHLPPRSTFFNITETQRKGFATEELGGTYYRDR